MKIQNNSLWQHIELTSGLMFNIAAFAVAAFVATFIITGMDTTFYDFKAENQMMLMLSIGFIVAMIQIIKPTIKDKNKGEPNRFYLDVNILCYAWLLFGILYDKELVILLNIVNITIATVVLTWKRGLPGSLVTVPFFIAIIFSLIFRENIQSIANTHLFTFVIEWNVGRTSEAFAATIEILPFLRKYIDQVKHGNYTEESVQGFFEMLFLYAGFLIWHYATGTFVAGAIVSLTTVVIIMNIYQDVHQPKKRIA